MTVAAPSKSHNRRLVYPGGRGMQLLPVEEIKPLAARAEGDPVRFRMSASSERIVTRRGFFSDWREQLSHAAGAVRMERFASGSAAMLEEHRGVPIGVVDSAIIDQKRIVADTRFSPNPRGQEAQRDVEARVRTNISIGYLVHVATLVEKNEQEGDLWRIDDWEPVEMSLVGVPADPSVGVGRSAGGEELDRPMEVRDGTAVREERTMLHRSPIEPGVAADPAQEKERTALAVKAAVEEQTNRIAEITDLCHGHNAADRIAKYVKDGSAVEQVMRELLSDKVKKLSERGGAGAEALDGLAKKDRKRYSYRRAIQMAIDNVLDQAKPDGIEGEVHRALAKQWPSGLERRGGLLIPMRLSDEDQLGELAVEKRVLDSKTLAKGTELVFEQPGELIELLRNRTYVLQMGARLLTGLSGPIAFPKQTGAATAYWVGENAAAVTASDVALGLVQVAPKTLQATMAYSRQLLAQATIDVETMVREELALIHSIAIDRASIHGLGAAGEPMGIYAAAGVGAQAFGGAPTFANMANLMKLVAQQNADQGALGFLTNPQIATELMTTLKAPGVASPFVWDGTHQSGTVQGYQARGTNQVSNVMSGSATTGGAESGIIFGNWGDLILALFSMMELVVDPYSQKKSGLIEITSFQLADVVPRHGESFAKSTGAT
jgi:HK97 family phage major capsid protein